ncbi:MAG: ABC transporter permease [Phycisphaerae bacterium]|nr:ABC transporter permease [Phycisphaerae bacterium]
MRLIPFEYAVRNASRSRPRLIASLVAAALVSMLALAAAAFVGGMSRSLEHSSRPENVILLGAGSEESLERSQIGANVADVVAASIPGIRAQLGTPFVSPEILLSLPLRTDRDADAGCQSLLRGITPAAFLVHPQVRIIEGRAPRPGHDELIVGGSAPARMNAPPEDLAVGRTVRLDNRNWTIVGRFAAPTTVMDAEFWCPLTDLQVATKRDSVSCVVVTLDAAEFADVDAFCKQRLDLELVAISETEYFRRLVEFYAPVRAVVWATAILIGLGGLFGGLNTMYAAFVARVREIGTLQTLGFSRLAIVINLVQESIVLAAAGGLAGVALGTTLFDGRAVRFSTGVLTLAVEGPAVATALVAALLLGIIGALPPAWRCLQLPIPAALRAA